MEAPTGYQGYTTQIPLGNLGVMTDMAPSEIPPTALIRAFDIDFGPGYLQKAPGTIRYNLTQLPNPIISLIDYWPNLHTQRLFAATSDGSIFRDIGDRTFSLGTAIKTGLGPLNVISQFVVGGAEIPGNSRRLFFFPGTAQLQVLQGDEATFAAVAEPATDWTSPNFPKLGVIHRNRLWAFVGNNYYASKTDNHENFTDTSALTGTVGPGDGGDILGVYVYKGKMIIFKEGDIVYYLNDASSDTADWYFTKLGEGFGVSSAHSAIQVLDDLLVGNNTGSVTSYQAVQAFGDIQSGDIFRAAKVNQFFRDNLSLSGFAYSQALWYPEKHIAFFTGRTKGGVANNALIALDLQNPNTPRYCIYRKDAADCLGLRRDIYNIKRPMYGAADGYVYLMDREDRSVGLMGSGVAYTGEFKTPHLDFRHLDPSLAHKNKNFDFLGVTFQEEGNHNLSVDVFLDGKFSQTITYTMTIDTNYCGAFVLGTSKLGSEDEKTRWQPIAGQAKRISFRCYNSGNNENFKVSQLVVGFNISGEDATRLAAS